MDRYLDRVNQAWFIFKNFAKIGYFWQLFLFSTLAAFLILIIAGRPLYLAFPEASSQLAMIWEKTAFIGFWSSCTAAAGILGMARFQEVLTNVVAAPRGGWTIISIMISPPALLGSLAFPLAYGMTGIWFGQLPGFGLTELCYSLVLIITGYLMTYPIATIFLITRHATTYELLILIPFLALSGILDWPIGLPPIWRICTMPASLPIYGFLTSTSLGELPFPSIVGFLLAIGLWVIVGIIFARKTLRHSLSHGTLELR